MQIFLSILIAVASLQTDFGSTFFDDLRTLFGKLEKTELSAAFAEAKPISCGDVVGRGDWKQVGFLNDDRSLFAWRFDKLEDVRSDPARLVFSGTCNDAHTPVEVTTTYPYRDSQRQYADGFITASEIVTRENKPVRATFDKTTGSYVFTLP